MSKSVTSLFNFKFRTGQFCDKCVKLPGCVNGYCNNSFECRCLDGWEGMNCDKGIHSTSNNFVVLKLQNT